MAYMCSVTGRALTCVRGQDIAHRRALSVRSSGALSRRPQAPWLHLSVASIGTISIPGPQIGCSDHSLRNSPLAIGYQAAAYDRRRATAFALHGESTGTIGQGHKV
jgi:hypothetical protein